MLGKKLANELSEELKVESLGKAYSLLKNTKSVSLIIFGNYYQNTNIKEILQILLSNVNNSFES